MIKKLLKTIAAIASVLAVTATAQAGSNYDQPAISGYDLVSYHQDSGPVRGTGFHAHEHDGATFLFSSKENLEAFKQNPEKYLPAYNGYCAYGAALGKKFNADPAVYEIVDGTLYLNLDASIQEKWAEDIPGHIAKGDKHWEKISKS